MATAEGRVGLADVVAPPTLADLADLEARLGVTLGDRALLELALTHRSFAFEQGGIPTNERLEFLGDAVLALVVTDMLIHALPDAPEGEMAKLRAAAVRTSALADVARGLDLGTHVRLGKGETATGGADKDSILADTFEALLGALYLDRGFDVAAELVKRVFAPRLTQLGTLGAALDYKTSLQELAARRFGAMPVYTLADEGPDHEKSFTAIVAIAGVERGRGTGRSKKKAEQDAARQAYRTLTTE